MIRAAVLGSPISHSLSPVLHKRAFEILGVAGEYSAIEVPSGHLHSFLDQEESHGWRGFSLTMPLKEEALVECVSLSTDSELLKATNTIISREQSWFGYNTDVLGFELLLQECDGHDVFILGAGATARAALLAARRSGMHTTVLRRNFNRDNDLRAIDRDVEILEWEKIAEPIFSGIVINATPAGVVTTELRGQIQYLVDSLYHPWPTVLMSKVGAGTKVFSGLNLLAAQAAYQVPLFTEREVSITELYPQLLEVGQKIIHS